MSKSYSRFRHLAIAGAKPAPTKEQLAAIEDQLGAVLPDSFREFLQVANGGYVEYVIDVLFGDGKSEPLSFCRIFSADDADFRFETFIGEILSNREYQKIPPYVLPFARDGGGSLACLDLSPEGHGRVVAYVEKLPEWAGLSANSGCIELASSFDEYVDRLRIDCNAVIVHLTHGTTKVEYVDATEEWLDIGMPHWREVPAVLGAVTEARRRVRPQLVND